MIQVKTADSFIPDSLPLLSIQTLRETGRDVPVLGEVDVLVCGGGPGGIGAAVAAAALAARKRVTPRQLDVPDLQTELSRQGVCLHPGATIG